MRYLLINYRDISTKEQRRDFFGHRVKLPPVTNCLTTQGRGISKYLAQGHIKQTRGQQTKLTTFLRYKTSRA